MAIVMAILSIVTVANAQQAPAANQLPQGGQVTSGLVEINQSGNVMNIDQTTQKAIINWNDFNVGKDATVNFNQPNSSSATLNRVVDPNPSQIFGRIVAPGQVILINPNGAYFAPSASVDVGGLIATTHELADKDFLDGNLQFKRNGSKGKVINEGKLKAKLDGYIALMAPEVINQGVIVAERGSVILASGELIQLNFGTGNKLTGITVSEQDLNAQIENKHAIYAEGGLVILSARATAELRASVIKNSGKVVASAGANTVTQRGGRIILEGYTIEMTNGAVLAATGSQGGGDILVGGDWQGGTNAQTRVLERFDAIYQATKITIESKTKIDASATDRGNGGTVVVWSDVSNIESVTTVQGEIFANGGMNGGDGGRIETSGARLFTDGVTGSAAAPMGRAGEWLFDPTNVTIGITGTAAEEINGTSISASSIAGLLQGGTSVTVTTFSAGNELGDLTVNERITKSSGNADVTLTLRAANSIVINQTIAHTGGAGKLNLVFDADNNTATSTALPVRDGAGIIILEAGLSTGGGDITFGGNRVNGYNGGDLYIGGGSNAITLSTLGGFVDVKGQLIVANSSTDGVTISTSGGNIYLRGSVDSGNSYTAVSGSFSWIQALDDAKNVPDSWLATITTSLENSLATRAALYQAAWLGGKRIIGTNLWQWVADPEYNASTNPMTFFYQGSTTPAELGGTSSGTGGKTAAGYFANWSSGWTDGYTGGSEPNNWTGSAPGQFQFDYESALQFTGTKGEWNDLPSGVTGSLLPSYLLNQYVRETNLAPSRLTLNAGSGQANIEGSVGASKVLSSLNVTASSTTVTNARALVTQGTQNYSGTLTVNEVGSILPIKLEANGMSGHAGMTVAGSVNINGGSVVVDGGLTAGGAVAIIANEFDVLLSGAIQNNSSSPTSLTVQAQRHIRLDTDASITSASVAMATQLWADTDGNGDGIVYVESEGIRTNGGNLIFGQSGQTLDIAGTTVLVGGDVFFQRVSSGQVLETKGGNLNVYGETIIANIAGLSIDTTGTSGDGNVVFHGLLNSGNQYTWIDKSDSAGTGSWNDARIEAKKDTLGGSAVGDSYLVNITSRLENSIAGLTANYRGAWIGAYRPDVNSYSWQWADGPDKGSTFFVQSGSSSSSSGGGAVVEGYYANFGTGEPNGNLSTGDRSTVESVGQFFGSEGLWNDLRDSTAYSQNQTTQYSVLGFVRETNLAASPLSIMAGAGSVSINGGVGTARALASLDVTSTRTQINGNGVVTEGAQKYSGSLTINSPDSTLDVKLESGAGIVTGTVTDGLTKVYGGTINLHTNLTTNHGDILLQGRNSILSNAVNRTLKADTGDIHIITDHLVQNNGNKVVIKSIGRFLFEPYGSSWTSYGEVFNLGGSISTDNFTGSFDAAGLSIDAVSSLAGLTIGKVGMSTSIQSDVAWSIRGPINFYGNDISINEALTSKGIITLTNSGVITIKDSAPISADGGFDQNGMGAIRLGADITTVNADIAIGAALTLLDNGTDEQLITLSTGAGAGNISLTSVTGENILNNGFKLHSGSGVITVSGAMTSINGLILQSIDATGTVEFQGNLNATNLSTAVANFDIKFLGDLTTVNDLVIFTNAGELTLGNSASDSLIFNSGMQATAPSMINLHGFVRAAGIAKLILGDDDTSLKIMGDSQIGGVSTGEIFLAATRLAHSTTLTLGVNTASDIQLTSLTGSAGGLGSNLVFNTLGTVTVEGQIGADVGEITINRAEGVIFKGTIDAEKLAISTNAASSGKLLSFKENVTLSTGMNVGAGLYDMSFAGSSNSIAGMTVFSNSGSVALGNFATDTNKFAGGLIAITPTIIRAAGKVETYSGVIHLGAVEMSANTIFNSINSPGADITIGTLNGVDNLIITAGTGILTFQGNVNAATMDITASSIRIGGGSDAVSTTGSQTYTGAVVLIANTTLSAVDGTTLSTITFSGMLDSDSTDVVTSESSFRTLSLTANAVFSDAVGSMNALGSLTILGITDIDGGGVKTSGNQSYGGDLRLGADTLITTVNSSVTFSKSINSNGVARAILIDVGTGNIDFDGALGNGLALGAVTIKSVATLYADGMFNSASFTQEAGSVLTQFDGEVTLSGNFDFTGTALKLNSTLASDGSVRVSNGGIFSTSAVGDIFSAGIFAQVGTGSNQLSGDISTTNSDVSFLRDVMLIGHVAIDTGAGEGDIVFGSKIDSDSTAFSLSLSSGIGNINFIGLVGSSVPLDAINIYSAQDVTLNGMRAASFDQLAGTGLTTLKTGLFGTDQLGLATTSSAGIKINNDAVSLSSLMTTSGLGGVRMVADNGLIIIAPGAEINADGEISISATSGIDISANISADNSNITISSALRSRSHSLIVDAGTGHVSLANNLNDFGALLTVIGSQAIVADANDLSIYLQTVGATFVTAGGELLVAGTVSGSSSDLSLVSGAKTVFDTLRITRHLHSTSRGEGESGGVSQIGVLEVGGAAFFIADTGALQNASLSLGNDFNSTVSFSISSNGSWNNIAIKDINSLEFGDVTATGNLNARAQTDVVLSGDVRVNTLDLTATTGKIDQTGGTLTVETGPSNLIAGTDITLESAANDFNGLVNAEGVNISVVDANALTLGDVTATGNLNARAQTDVMLSGDVRVNTLDLTAMTGKIDQTGGTLTVETGPSNLIAGTDITLESAANDFNGLVNAEGENIKLADKSGLKLGQVNARSNLSVSTFGSLDLGIIWAGGEFTSVTHGGSITQTGALRVDGFARLDAGSGSITLSHPDNYFPKGTKTRASRVIVTGDSAEAMRQPFGLIEVDMEIMSLMSQNSTAAEILIISSEFEKNILIESCSIEQSSKNLLCF